MSRLVACSFALASALALPAGARDLVFPPSLPDPVEQPATPKTPELNWRATQINRCPDGRGGVTLQDSPCAPVAATRAASVAGPVEVVDLAALPPRPPVEVVAPAAPAPSTDYGKGMLYGAGKLSLILLACYLVFRFALIVRDEIRRRRVPDEIPNHGPMPR